MGEVYRADDIKLGQAVALKLLPESFGAGGPILDRFYGEVRIARQVSHPNVCRVYDVGEWDGLHYISMEYIDGEDLGSLLRRIGRLPGDKAVEISRQICAGLAAAHDKGVLHRDLKPGNVMIDGRGHARIADFGLAGLADEIRGGEIRSGTPAYMAPEQLAGTEVSVRSDVYALGLVLYELFTGKRAFEAESLDQLRRLHESNSVTSPSSHVHELDPAVERVILRCLDRDPAQRPAGAIAVAAALPGGDPLAAALAAGETPSPEMVAAAGTDGALRPVVAWGAFAGVVIGLLAVGLLASGSSIYSFVTVVKTPEVLSDRARSLLDEFGYTTEPADTAHGFGIDSEYTRWIQEEDPSPDRWERLREERPAAIYFWHRESPRSLVPLNQEGRIWWGDPPETVSGMATVFTDTAGRLRELRAVPPQVEEPSDSPEGRAGGGPPGWDALFAAAGLDLEAFTPAEPSWTPPSYADARAAWTGAYPELPEVALRVEAAAYRGRPVYFEIVGPWSRPERVQVFQPGIGPIIGQAVFAVLFAGVILSAIIIARRNIRVGRGDRRGASRVGVYLFSVTALAGFFGASHVASVGDEFSLIVNIISGSLFISGFVWLLYLAIEPLIRKSWPEAIISWSRLLAGKFRDPLVGRDALTGCVSGVALMIAERLYHIGPLLAGGAPPAPRFESRAMLLGIGGALNSLFNAHLQSMFFAMLLFFFFYIGSIRGKNLIGAAIFFSFYATMDSLFRGEPWSFGIPMGLLSAAIVTTTYYRFGLLTAIVTLMFDAYNVPITLDVGTWWAGHAAAPLLVVVGFAGYAAWIAQGHRPAVRPAAQRG